MSLKDVVYLRDLLNAVKTDNDKTTKSLLGLDSEKEMNGDLVSSRVELGKPFINKTKYFRLRMI